MHTYMVCTLYTLVAHKIALPSINPSASALHPSAEEGKVEWIPGIFHDTRTWPSPCAENASRKIQLKTRPIGRRSPKNTTTTTTTTTAYTPSAKPMHFPFIFFHCVVHSYGTQFECDATFMCLQHLRHVYLPQTVRLCKCVIVCHLLLHNFWHIPLLFYTFLSFPSTNK